MRLFILAVFVQSLICSCITLSVENCGERRDPSWKWYARIIHTVPIRESVLCEATVLNDRFVLTVAHCLLNLNGDKIDTGELWILLQDGEKRAIEATYHPNEFNVEGLEDDILLIMMDRVVLFNVLVGPVCLSPESNEWKLEQIIVPSLGNKSLQLTDERTCHSNTLKIFQLTYEGAICLGIFKETYKYIMKSGSGLFTYFDGKWFIVGIQMYAAGDTKDRITYIGAVSLQMYMVWIKQILKYYTHSNIAKTRCDSHKGIAGKTSTDSFKASQPTVSLVESQRSSSRTVCHGTLISHRFVLTTVKCAQKSSRVFIPYSTNSSEWFNNLTFHYEKWDNKIALIELDRGVSNPSQVMSCLWHEKREKLYEFTTHIDHPGSFIHLEGIRVQYRLSTPLQVKFYCSRYLHLGQFAMAGDAIIIKENGIDVRVVGLLDENLQCESWDYFYERQKTAKGINLDKYLPWIEDIAGRRQ